jgi:polyphosphate kinase 2 (PPK2 family)
MGFCTKEEYEEFFRSVTELEKMLIRSGIKPIKYWFSIIDEEQDFRFRCPVNDPLKQWKLSPMDLESRRRWEEYTVSKEIMLDRTHIPEARWWIVSGVDNKRARLDFIRHLLNQVPYTAVAHPEVMIPHREHHPDYHRKLNPQEMIVPEFYR